jgi:TPP-dependent pyruvate/acetoin dehydrogenase alpha subunit
VIDHPGLYRTMFTIRRFEETVLAEFKRGVFSGTTHTSLGQEANAAGVLSALSTEDAIFSNHRCHGHFIAYGGDLRALFAELMGRATGVCGGRGGSQHLHWRNFYASGIQGGGSAMAVGQALAFKRNGGQHIVTLFIGDGTFGEGLLYESLNMAALWQVPLLIVVEDNHIAQTTPTERVLAGSMVGRFAAFGIPCTELDSSDVLEIQSAATGVLAQVRAEAAPRALILHTCRFGPHSKGDDTRPEAEVERMRFERDPLRIHAPRLSEADRLQIEAEVEKEVAIAFEQALADPFPKMEEQP